MAVDRQEPLALLAAWVGAIKDVVVIFRQMRRAFQRHGSADVVVGQFDVLLREPKAAEQIKRRIVQLFGRDTKRAGAELFAKRPLVEHKANVEGRGQCRFDLVQLRLTKPVPDQRSVVDARRIADGAVTNRVGHDFLDLGGPIAKNFKSRWHRLVDDFEIPAARKLLELHQRKVRFDPRGVAIHDQTDGARGRNHCGLRIPEPVLFTHLQGFVPGFLGQRHQLLIRTIRVIQGNRVHVHILVPIGFAVSGVPVVANDAQHVLGVLLVL